MTALSYAFMQKAVIACALVCAVAPLAGSFVVQREQSLIGDGIGHVAFAGVGLAFLTGINPLLGALGLTVLAAFALFRLERRGNLGGDLSLALIFYGGIALGFMFTSRSGGGLNTIMGFLFGSPLNLTWGQVGAIAALCLAVLAAVIALYGPLIAIAFDEPAARVSGLPTDGVMLTLTLIVAFIVVGGMYALGLLLVSAMMVVPVAAASQVCRSYRSTMMVAAGVGGFSAVAGVFTAYYADLTTGSSIVLIAIGCYVVAAGVRSARTRYAAAAA